jgi:hypothetical protein
LSGLALERERSREFHADGLPLLVSPKLLRSRELGQLDLARMKKKESWILEVAEVKTSSVGDEALERGQRKRIVNAAKFLSGIFGCPVKFIRLVG